MLAVAARKAATAIRRTSLPVVFVQAKAEELPFADATFDLVVCVTALEFTASPAQAVAEMVRGPATRQQARRSVG